MEWHAAPGVGPDGLIIVHDTTTPMFATENFADYVVATEWGYRNGPTGPRPARSCRWNGRWPVRGRAA